MPEPKYVQPLTTALERHNEQIATLRRESDELKERGDATREAVAELQKKVALVQQSIQQLRKDWDDWDRKRWILVGLVVGAVFSFVANLMLVLARK
jgi:uncharacterized coiled-coil DUF342 family protein